MSFGDHVTPDEAIGDCCLTGIKPNQRFREAFARRFAASRKRMGLTQAVTAKRIGVSHSSVARWEIASELPRRYYFADVCKYMGIDMDELVELID